MKKRTKTKKNRTAKDAALAVEYSCDSRTIARWRADGAPLADPAKMRAWLAGRKNLPPGTLAIVMEQRRAERVKRAETLATGPAEATGAAAALARIEQAEELASRALQAAERTGDPIETRLAERKWLAIADKLLDYDRRVQASRRANDLVPKAMAEAAFRNIGLALKIALPSVFERATPLIHGTTDMRQLGKILRDIGRSLASAVVAVGVGAPQIELPTWASEAITGGADFLGKSWPPSRLAATQQAVSALFEMSAAQALAETAEARSLLTFGTEQEVQEFRAWRAQQQQELAEHRRRWCVDSAAAGRAVPDASAVELAQVPGLSRG